MQRVNEGKEWSKEDILEFWNTPKADYKKLAEKLGRSDGAIDMLHVTKEKIHKISSIVRPNRPNKSYADKYMLELFIEGNKPKM